MNQSSYLTTLTFLLAPRHRGILFTLTVLLLLVSFDQQGDYPSLGVADDLGSSEMIFRAADISLKAQAEVPFTVTLTLSASDSLRISLRAPDKLRKTELQITGADGTAAIYTGQLPEADGFTRAWVVPATGMYTLRLLYNNASPLARFLPLDSLRIGVVRYTGAVAATESRATAFSGLWVKEREGISARRPRPTVGIYTPAADSLVLSSSDNAAGFDPQVRLYLWEDGALDSLPLIPQGGKIIQKFTYGGFHTLRPAAYGKLDTKKEAFGLDATIHHKDLPRLAGGEGSGAVGASGEMQNLEAILRALIPQPVPGLQAYNKGDSVIYRVGAQDNLRSGNCTCTPIPLQPADFMAFKIGVGQAALDRYTKAAQTFAGTYGQPPLFFWLKQRYLDGLGTEPPADIAHVDKAGEEDIDFAILSPQEAQAFLKGAQVPGFIRKSGFVGIRENIVGPLFLCLRNNNPIAAVDVFFSYQTASRVAAPAAAPGI
ncbi:MAG: hypothetical protein SF053_16100 [Bacteroidia bacterium]|nr:hypothetical protein [Bacteroidia bacterium]